MSLFFAFILQISGQLLAPQSQSSLAIPKPKTSQVAEKTSENNEPTSGIQQANFFPPPRHLFPDNTPGRVNPIPGAIPNQIPSLIPFEDLEPKDLHQATDAPLPFVWGGVGFKAIPTGTKMGPNGVEFDPVFTLEMELNIALCESREVYIFTQSRFWGQKAAPGITNASQGNFDFSKREFDLSGGLAWNYWRTMEARVFAYSYNNLNRGYSLSAPYGYKDGVGISNRYYYLGNNFFGAGYLPTKELIGNNGEPFKPSWFLENSIWVPIYGPRYQGYWGTSLIGQRSGDARLFYNDLGVSAACFKKLPTLEFRTGTEITTDLVAGNTLAFYYLGLYVPF